MWIWISMACAALSLYLLAWWLGRPYAVANESLARPKRMALSLMWPWVDAVAHACGPFMTWRQRRHLQQLLQRAGAHAPWSPQHLCALQIILGTMAGGLAMLMLHEALSAATLLVFVSASAAPAALWPVARLRRRIRVRRQAMLRQLPFMLDMVTLCVEAGLNLHGALRQVASHGPGGALYDELHRMLSDIRTGAPQRTALLQWAQRCELRELHYFVSAVAQAEQSGMSLGPVLRAQAGQRRSERFQRAEKLALEAPVKLMFPLITCIFPCSFLIIAVPIAAKFMALA